MVVSMNRWKGKVAVVTGASAGIGAAIAEALVNEGMKVVGLARRKEKIEEEAKRFVGKSGKLYAFRADMTKEKDILAAFKWTKENVGPVHVLINNAGILRETTMTDGETEKWKEVLDVNVIGLSIATREAVKMMKENNIDGHIININSTGGHKVTDGTLNMYFASKYAVTALTETVRLELVASGSKIKITSVSPGLVMSEMGQGSGFVIPPEVLEMLKSMPILETSDVADAVIYVLSTPPGVQVNELTLRATGSA